MKLIQKKGGAFPIITLKKDLELTGSEPGAVLKMYDDDWFGNPVTVVEMDGETDMGNMEAQLRDIEENLEGLAGKTSTEPTEAMTKLKSGPGHRTKKVYTDLRGACARQQAEPRRRRWHRVGKEDLDVATVIREACSVRPPTRRRTACREALSGHEAREEVHRRAQERPPMVAAA